MTGHDAPGSKSQKNVMIGIMGPTGTGKSSFIALVTGNKDVEVGHGVQSMTSEIGLYHYFERSGRRVTFVDTPGFDDSREGVTDTDILRKIATFLDVEFKDGKKLSGVIYLHRITDPRMGGISVRNLKMFGKLCGQDALKNVIVVTTRWDDTQEKDKEAMVRRENELMTTKGKFFEPFITAGGRFLRHDNTMGSARRIMEKVLDNDPITLQIQAEMDKGMKLEETAAGSELAAEMNRLIAKHTGEMEHLRKEMADAIAEKDEELRKELEAERTKLKKEMEKWETEKKRLAGDLDSVRQAAEVAKKETETKMGQQREEFLRKVREAEEKALKEQKQLKDAMDRMEKEKQDASKKLKVLEDAKNNMDQNNRAMLAQVQAQIDQAKRDKEATDRKHQQMLKSMRARVCHWRSHSGTFYSSYIVNPSPIPGGVLDGLSCFITRNKHNNTYYQGWAREGGSYLVDINGVQFHQYDVLVGDSTRVFWVSYHGRFKISSLSYTPICSWDKEVDNIYNSQYIARFNHFGNTYAGQVSEDGFPSVLIDKTSVEAQSYEVLCYRDL